MKKPTSLAMVQYVMLKESTDSTTTGKQNETKNKVGKQNTVFYG